MTEQTVGEYRLTQVERSVENLALKVDKLVIKLDELPDRLDIRYATKAEVTGVREDLTALVEERKVQGTSRTAWAVGIVSVVAGVVLTGAGSVVWYVVQTMAAMAGK